MSDGSEDMTRGKESPDPLAAADSAAGTLAAPPGPPAGPPSGFGWVESEEPPPVDITTQDDVIFVRNAPGSGFGDNVAEAMALACDALLRELAAVWNLSAPPVVFCSDRQREFAFASPHAYTFVLDGPDGGVPRPQAPREERIRCAYDQVGTATRPANGRRVPTLIDITDSSTPTVSKILFTKIADLVLDPTRCRSFDIWTPVRDSCVLYSVTEARIPVTLPNFLYPAFWGPRVAWRKSGAAVLPGGAPRLDHVGVLI